ncbi:hypothetical protein OPIT5_27815 [Opitutaceae bacterium TAV5]|nr:hypothetical protein OPIT5_27815 [Opitutaceae bacterium TAV5]
MRCSVNGFCFLRAAGYSDSGFSQRAAFARPPRSLAPRLGNATECVVPLCFVRQRRPPGGDRVNDEGS